MPKVTILSGQTVSNNILLGGELIGLMMPAAFTGTAITFQSKRDDGTYVPVHDKAGVAVSITVAGGRHIVIPLGTLPGLRDIKLVSGTAEGANRDIVLIQQS